MFKSSGSTLTAIAVLAFSGISFVRYSPVMDQSHKNQNLVLASYEKRPVRDVPITIRPHLTSEATLDETHLNLFRGISSSIEKLTGQAPASTINPIEISGEQDGLSAVAAKSECTTYVLLKNTSAEKTRVKIEFFRQNGVCSFAECEISPETKSHSERLESLIVTDARPAAKAIWMAPNSTKLFEMTNRTKQLDSQYSSLRRELVDHIHAGETWCLSSKSVLDEARAPIEAILSRKAISRPKLVQLTHRAIHFVDQSHALLRNNGNSNGVAGASSDALFQGFDRVNSTLSEISVACMNLVAGFDEEPLIIGTQSKFVVHVRNCGSHTVSSIMINLKGEEGTSISPKESALFGELSPGQTASAEFTVDLSNSEVKPKLSADVSYSTSHSPAHLRMSLN
ncbi:MAG: hypothetical protein ABJA67_12495 [Chthonomonadales bacterium]